MNYLHAYHAGNFADCFKHALLVALLDRMTQKPTPFFVLDTHAGAGRYDLKSLPSQKTNEAAEGIMRLLALRPDRLRRFVDVVDTLGLYPGSPIIIRHLLRDGDRLACCETQPDVLHALRMTFRTDPIVHVHGRSGWEALGALLPPTERRGIVFVDPPFEDPDEFDTLVRGINQCHARFSHGVLAAWYPLKRQAAVRNFYSLLKHSGIRDIIAIEMNLRAPTDASRFDGCGMLIINPPYRFEQEAVSIVTDLIESLGSRTDGGGAEFVRLADE